MSATQRIELKPYLLTFLLPVILMLFSSSCQKPSIAFGTGFVSNNNTNIILTDTPTVQLSTILLDSFSTAGTGAALLGRYHDPSFGTITARTFFQIGAPPRTVISTEQGVGVDSICLIMFINKTFYADTTVTQRYYVSQLDTNIMYPYLTQRSFYNNSSIPYNPIPWGSTEVRISPTANYTSQHALDSVKIRLPDTLGQTLLRMIQNNSDTITNLSTFLSYFKGLTVYPDTTGPYTGAIFGFKDSSIVRLYYHVPGIITTFNFVNFPFNTKAYQFNQITVDRTGTPLQILSQLQASRPNPLIPTEAPSSLTNNSVFVQGTTGIQTKILFPNLQNIATLPDYLGISRAILVVKPQPTSYNPLFALPPQLILSETNQNNGLGLTITNSAGNETGNLVTDYVYGINTEYTYDITNYVKQLITITGGVVQNGLILNVPTAASTTTLNRAVFADQTNPNYTIKLNLYYVSLIH